MGDGGVAGCIGLNFMINYCIVNRGILMDLVESIVVLIAVWLY